LGKGGDLKRLIAEIYGKSSGCSGGKGGSMHLIDTSVGFMGSTAIVANSIPVGVGLGLSIKLHGTEQISCIFLGDAAVEEGAFHESVNFAVVRKLPVLFICENNLYSVYSPLSVRQPQGRKIHEMVRAAGISSDCGDGNNAYEVYTLTKKVVESIRKGTGPVFLEFSTYRWREHCGPNYDNTIGYRTEEEFLSWKAKDPIVLFVESLKDKGMLHDGFLGAIEQKIHTEISEAFEFAENSPFPEHEMAFSQLFKQ
jgi:pyruvate dehydrogenase E1 component alpha subunit